MKTKKNFLPILEAKQCKSKAMVLRLGNAFLQASHAEGITYTNSNWGPNSPFYTNQLPCEQQWPAHEVEPHNPNISHWLHLPAPLSRIKFSHIKFGIRTQTLTQTLHRCPLILSVLRWDIRDNPGQFSSSQESVHVKAFSKVFFLL